MCAYIHVCIHTYNIIILVPTQSGLIVCMYIYAYHSFIVVTMNSRDQYEIIGLHKIYIL